MDTFLSKKCNRIKDYKLVLICFNVSISLHRGVLVISVAALCLLMISASLPANAGTVHTNIESRHGQANFIVKQAGRALIKNNGKINMEKGKGSTGTLSEREKPVYSKSTATAYCVNFTETGLPNATLWYLKLSNNLRSSSTSVSISVSLSNGSYSYFVSSSNNLYGANGGRFDVSGASQNVNITFYRVYPVKFNALGIRWNGTSLGWAWAVNVSEGPQELSFDPFIQFYFPNGTYHYDTTSSNRSYLPVNASGSFSIKGSSVSVNITFKLIVFAVTFREIGLPQGSTWELSFNGTSSNISSISVQFSVPNGTYHYNTNASQNYTSKCESGLIRVNGTSISKNISFCPAAQSKGHSIFTLTNFIIITAAIAVALATVIYVKRRK